MDRTQQVAVNSVLSETLPVTAGVTQGSILSPLLFVLYTADIQTALQGCNHYAYADDMQLAATCSLLDLQESLRHLEAQIKVVEQWSFSDLLKLNVQKTVFFAAYNIYIQAGQIAVNLNGRRYEAAPTVRILGIFFDSDLMFREQSRLVAAKMTSFLRILSARRCYFPRWITVATVNAYVRSRLLYGISFLGMSASLRDRYQLLQNYALRVIYGLRKFDHVTEHRLALGWLTIAKLSDYRFAIMAIRAIHGLASPY